MRRRIVHEGWNLRRCLSGVMMLFTLACGVSGSHSPASAEEAPVLRFDPFRPREPEQVGAADPEDRRSPELDFRPVLLSTIVGQRRSAAILGGVLLDVGDEAHGYRLLEVRAFDATFERKGERVVLEVLQGEAEPR